MPIIQSIDSALEKNVGAPRRRRGGAGRRAGAGAKARSTGCASAMPRARCRCCGCRNGSDDLAGIRDAADKLAEGASDIVMLGTGGSSLGGQTLAQLAGYQVPGIGALREGPRLHFIDNLDPHVVRGHAGEAAARHHALRRHLQVRRHRRDA